MHLDRGGGAARAATARQLAARRRDPRIRARRPGPAPAPRLERLRPRRRDHAAARRLSPDRRRHADRQRRAGRLGPQLLGGAGGRERLRPARRRRPADRSHPSRAQLPASRKRIRRHALRRHGSVRLLPRRRRPRPAARLPQPNSACRRSTRQSVWRSAIRWSTTNSPAASTTVAANNARKASRVSRRFCPASARCAT